MHRTRLQPYTHTQNISTNLCTHKKPGFYKLLRGAALLLANYHEQAGEASLDTQLTPSFVLQRYSMTPARRHWKVPTSCGLRTAGRCWRRRQPPCECCTVLPSILPAPGAAQLHGWVGRAEFKAEWIQQHEFVQNYEGLWALWSKYISLVCLLWLL